MSLFTAGITALQAAQAGLATAGHNIANVNTPGYTRERVNLAPNIAVGAGVKVGSGVSVASITRVYNEFLTAQTRDVGSQLAYSQTLSDELTRLSTTFGDEATGISPALNSFFGSVHDLAANPSSATARSTMIASANSLVDRLQSVDEQLRSYGDQSNAVISTTVQEINVYSTLVSDLNAKIVLQSANGQPPNDLLDQRDQALRELSDRVRVSVIKQVDGAVNVFLGNGQSLVVGGDRFDLRAETDPINPTSLRLSLEGNAGARVPLDIASIGGGSLAAQVGAKTSSVDGAEIALGRLARVIADQFNAQHALGVDAAGEMGGQFFRVAAPSANASPSNRGGATLGVAIADATQLKASEYQLTRTTSGYTLRRLADNTTTTYSSLPQTVDGFTVSVSGTPSTDDTFLIQPVRNAVSGLAMLISDPNKIAAGAPVRSSANLANLGDAKITAPAVASAGSNLRQTVTLTFTSATQFNVSGTGTGNPTGVAYTSGGTIAYNGWTASISGTPKAGDVFTIQTNTVPAGDNRNASALAAIGARPIVDGSSISTAYGTALAAVGTAAREATLSATAQKSLYESAQAAEASVSGVNLDEEAADLLRYQQAYQAAAKYMQIAGDVFTELLTLGR